MTRPGTGGGRGWGAVRLFVLLCAAATAQEFVPPVLTVPCLPAGRHDSAAVEAAVWALPPAVPAFVVARGEHLALARTELRLAYDGAALYAAFSCRLPPGPAPAAGPPPGADQAPAATREDGVELFLAPPGTPPGGYLHLIASCSGLAYQERGRDPAGWRGSWTARTRRTAAGWSVLVRLPFSEAGAAPRPGARWRGNFGRNAAGWREYSSWSPVADESFHRPEFFGQLRFAAPGLAGASVGYPEWTGAGQVRTRVLLDNPRRDAAWFRAAFHAGSERLAAFHRAAPPGTTVWPLSAPFRPEGGYQTLRVEVTGTGGEVLARTPDLPFATGPFLPRWGEDPAAWLRAAGATPSAAGPPTAARAERDERGRARCAALDGAGRGYVIFPDSSLRKRFPDVLAPPADNLCELRISLGRQEAEAGQLIVAAQERALAGVQVELSALREPGGVRLPAGAVSLRLVDWVTTRRPVYPVSRVGRWPDPLLPLRPFAVAAGGVRAVWLTARIPPDTPAGVYRGLVTVTPANAPPATLPVAVRVWDFTLPVPGRLRTAFAFHEEEAEAWYGRFDGRLRRRWQDFLLEHRLNPLDVFAAQPSPAAADLARLRQRGLNTASAGYVEELTPAAFERRIGVAAAYQRRLAAEAPEAFVFSLGYDEAPPDRHPLLRDEFLRLHERLPGLPRACTLAPDRSLAGVVDVWVPLTAFYREADARDCRARGEQVWWYVCCFPWFPYANWFVDYPALPGRLLFWMNWKYRVPGVLYYSINNWQSNRQCEGLPPFLKPHGDPILQAAVAQGRRWPDIPWNSWTYWEYNGDGQLVYPGPGGEPVGSIRLECIRDGIEDYETLALLAERVRQARRPEAPPVPQTLLMQAAELLEVPPEVVRSLTEYTLDPDRFLDTREQLGNTLEALSRYLEARTAE
ncbi:MAG: glycoside hydrolase domain-containing protein [Lentisphaeria bacterium]